MQISRRNRVKDFRSKMMNLVRTPDFTPYLPYTLKGVEATAHCNARCIGNPAEAKGRCDSCRTILMCE